jgi:glyoxylase-like metal-dependent hydrolase (beta-lactamase superfamily II)
LRRRIGAPADPSGGEAREVSAIEPAGLQAGRLQDSVNRVTLGVIFAAAALRAAHEEARMIFRQLFDSTSGTYTYLLASRRGGEALIIDPVLERVERYLQLVRELDLRLVKAVDTHLHADHVTGLGALRDRTHCITVMGEHTQADVVSMRVAEGDYVGIEGVRLDVLYTPGHTDDSYSFLLADRVFTGDTLPDPRHRPHRFPERRPARAVRFHLPQAHEAARRDARLSRARL